MPPFPWFLCSLRRSNFDYPLAKMVKSLVPSPLLNSLPFLQESSLAALSPFCDHIEPNHHSNAEAELVPQLGNLAPFSYPHWLPIFLLVAAVGWWAGGILHLAAAWKDRERESRNQQASNCWPQCQSRLLEKLGYSSSVSIRTPLMPNSSGATTASNEQPQGLIQTVPSPPLAARSPPIKSI